MGSKKWLSALLTSASFLTLSVASIGRASAAGTTRTGPGAQTVAGHFDWVNIDAPAMPSFTNNGQISNGFTNPDSVPNDYANAVHVRTNASVGSFVNNGQITAAMGTAPANGAPTSSASAVGVYIQGVVGSLTNNGSILAKARAQSTAADSFVEASAYGVYWNPETSSAAAVTLPLTNNGSIIANATAIATGSGSQGGSANATGVFQGFKNQGPVTAIVHNTSVIAASATVRAESSGSASVSEASVSEVSAFGIHQFFSVNSTGALGVTNSSGSITAAINASAGGGQLISPPELAAIEKLHAVGVDQEIDANGPASAAVVNNALISATIAAHASATYFAGVASATAQGIFQNALADGTAAVGLTNTGQVLASVNVTAGGGKTDGGGVLQPFAAVVGGTYEGGPVAATGVSQVASGSGDASAAVVNSATIAASLNVAASASAIAFAFDAGAIGIDQSVDSDAVATALVSNTGSVTAAANIGAAAGTYALVSDVGVLGVIQEADGDAGALAAITNTSVISATLNAHAAAETYAIASGVAAGAVQEVGPDGPATASLANSGQILASSTLTAGGFATSEGAVVLPQVAVAAATYLEVAGVLQGAESGDVAAVGLTNTATISATSVSLAQAGNAVVTYEGDFLPAGALAVGESFGVVQLAGAETGASASLINTATISALSTANASVGSGIAVVTGTTGEGAPLFDVAGAEAVAAAVAEGVVQEASAGTSALAGLANSGVISAAANASAVAGATYAGANAFGGAIGVGQFVTASDTAISDAASLVNTGTIAAQAVVNASAGTYAAAEAEATGAGQVVDGGAVMSAYAYNSGVISAVAIANATANGIDGSAHASASATGLFQQFSYAVASESASLLNDSTGVISAVAVANAFGTGSTPDDAFADALGVGIGDFAASGSEDIAELHLNVVNNGVISALAEANANTFASAQATGIRVFSEDTIDGLLANSGTIQAEAIANGTPAFAHAIGVVQESGDGNDTTFVNTGTISAYAQTNGGFAQATGILVTGEGATGTHQATIVNNGNLIAAISNDGGATLDWGTAIDTTGAPNPVTISLQDPPLEHGYVFGNILTNPADTIEVSNGATWFSGIVNPGDLSASPFTILDGGKFLLLNQDPGPSQVYSSAFTVQPGGTLGMQLGTDTTVGANPQVFATNISLSGKFVADFLPGLYGDSFTYLEALHSTNPIVGAFTETGDNSALLNTTAFNDPNGVDVDIAVTRNAFGAVPGLTQNQQAVGNAIETVYPQVPSGDPAFANLVANLFALNDEDYPRALNALSGAEYAQELQSLLWSPTNLNATITDRMDCGSNWTAGGGRQSKALAGAGRDGCFDPGHFQAWGRITGSWNNNDGDGNAPGYDESQFNLIAGADYAFTSRWFAGLAIGYLNTNMDFDNWAHVGGSSIDYDGAQLAIYGGYDANVWYARAIGTFGWFSGSSHRNVMVGPSILDPSGDQDASVQSFYGEVGRRYQWQQTTTITPFAGLSLAHAHLDGFTESDPEGSGAALHVDGTSGDSLASVLGVRLNGEWGAWKPELSIAWQHEFLDEVQSVHNAFVSAPPGADFTVVGSNPGRDSALISLGTTYAFTGSSDVTLRYDGRFSSGYSTNAISGRWTTKF